jgi:ketosteroid isomerase-like protein
MKTVRTQLLAWHKEFARCVRARDFASGRAMFSPACQCFGTRIEFAENSEHLMQSQWVPIWSSTRSFRFLAAPFEVILSDDGSIACVLTLWESSGIGPDGKTFPRRGRCTTVLRRDESHSTKWLAIHTHYSRTPNGKLEHL